MMARAWHGRVPSSKTEAYYQYLLATGLSDYAATPGNRGVYVFRSKVGEVSEFLITTLWESLDAIKRFAGEDYERARYYPEDDDYLLEREPLVAHYEVLQATFVPGIAANVPTIRSRRLEYAYLVLALVNAVVVVGYSIWQSVLTGNILFWTDPARTTAELFANGTSTAFGLDLAGVVLVVFIWMWQEARRLRIPAVWRFWLLTLLFGLAAPLPLFLYLRERRMRLTAI